MRPVRLEPVASRSRVKHSTTEPLRSLFFPIIRKLMTDPHGMAKLDPKGTDGTIYAGNKTLLYTKCINYGPHRKDF